MIPGRGGVRRVAAWVIAVWSLLVTPAAARAQNTQWGANYFPNVTLTTHEGARVRFYDDLIKGKIVAVNLIYTTCTFACPLETARLAQVHRLVGERMGREVFFYSITIDPEHDTPAVLKAYAEKFHAGPGWLFLTGRREDIELISRRTGLYSPSNPTNADGHTPHLLVGNEVTGQWLRHSAVDDPRFLATTISTWMKSWREPSRTAGSYVNAPAIDAEPGQYVFTRHCAACHTIGGGDRVGPDLLDVTSSRDRAWLARFVREPDAVRAAGDPAARALSVRFAPAVMPRLGLSAADVAAVLQYIERRSEAADHAAPASRSGASMPPGSLAALVDPYLQIQQALAGDSLNGIAEHVGALRLAATARGGSAASITAALEAMNRPDIAAVRAAFARLSDALIALAGEHQGALAPDITLAYCPMARAHWLQRGTRIRNPYYGPQMADCGRLVTGTGTNRDTAVAPLPVSPPQQVRTPGPVRAP